MRIKPGMKLFLGKERSSCLEKRAGVEMKNRQHSVPLHALKHRIPDVQYKKALPLYRSHTVFFILRFKNVGKSAIIHLKSAIFQCKAICYKPQGVLCFTDCPLLLRFGVGIKSMSAVKRPHCMSEVWHMLSSLGEPLAH